MRRRRKKRKIWLPILITLLVMAVIGIGAVAAVWHYNEYDLRLELLGDEEITLEYGAVYEDPGARSSFRGSLLLREVQVVPVQVVGTVDTAVVGTYELRYVAEVHYRDLFWDRTETKEVKRTVHVVDTKAPVITLTTQEGYYTLPGQEYAEEGFSAADGYDGDLTDRVVRTVTGDTVVYMVTDSSGNAAQVTRTIVYDDPTAPELTLNGEQEITLTEGESFADPGAVAYDNCDGDLTGSIAVSGSVDTNTPGTYTLTYTVSDAWGNQVTAARTVVVKEKPAPPPAPEPEPEPDPNPEPEPEPEPDPLPVIPEEPLPPNGKVIYLTFDDGPGSHTSRLLDILDKYNVKATFFINGTSYLDDVLPRMAQSGHTIAMHTYTHTYSKVYASDEAFFNDLYAIQNEILAYTGQTSMILRFPGGSSNTISRNYSKGIMTRLTQQVEEMGYRYFDWNVDSMDAGGARTADQVYRNVANGIANSSRQSFVVLQHDVKGFSVDAVERIIQWGLANGYTFEALTLDSPECEHALNN